jgi:tRNA (cytidine/uridine-2'-O-)-methyltransferase
VGNIGRLCACTGSDLILVGDLGFSLGEKYLKRAGMDYLEHVQLRHYPDFPDVLAAYEGWTFSMYSTKARHLYTQAPFQDRHLLIFGSEDRGLPEAILAKYADQSFRIPMLPDRRSLNLSTSAGIVLYEALRQLHHWPSPA